MVGEKIQPNGSNDFPKKKKRIPTASPPGIHVNGNEVYIGVYSSAG